MLIELPGHVLDLLAGLGTGESDFSRDGTVNHHRYVLDPA
jgi:hypothetical protein